MSDRAHAGPAPLAVAVVMGVSGAGKTTIGAMLAGRLGCEFADGDWFHSAANIRKMQSSVPLTDEDRGPWLQSMATWIDERRRAKAKAVIACSVLKRSYRAVVIGNRPDVRLIYLEGDPELIAGRQAARRGHFMPAALLGSQFDTLEPPGPDEHPIVVSIEPPPHQIVSEIVLRLKARTASPVTKKGGVEIPEESPG